MAGVEDNLTQILVGGFGQEGGPAAIAPEADPAAIVPEEGPVATAPGVVGDTLAQGRVVPT